VNRHNYTRRIGIPGENLWQCQATDCGDSGPLKELMARECAHVDQPGEQERNLLHALGCDDNVEPSK
jgi:hypothetical protein